MDTFFNNIYNVLPFPRINIKNNYELYQKHVLKWFYF